VLICTRRGGTVVDFDDGIQLHRSAAATSRRCLAPRRPWGSVRPGPGRPRGSTMVMLLWPPPVDPSPSVQVADLLAACRPTRNGETYVVAVVGPNRRRRAGRHLRRSRADAAAGCSGRRTETFGRSSWSAPLARVTGCSSPPGGWG